MIGAHVIEHRYRCDKRLEICSGVQQKGPSRFYGKLSVPESKVQYATPLTL
jgi:hypothetical protein